MTSISSNKVSANELSMEAAKKAGKKEKAQKEESIFNETNSTATTLPKSEEKEALETTKAKGFFEKVLDKINDFFSGSKKAEDKDADSTKTEDSNDEEYEEVEVYEQLSDGTWMVHLEKQKPIKEEDLIVTDEYTTISKNEEGNYTAKEYTVFKSGRVSVSEETREYIDPKSIEKRDKEEEVRELRESVDPVIMDGKKYKEIDVTSVKKNGDKEYLGTYLYELKEGQDRAWE